MRTQSMLRRYSSDVLPTDRKVDIERLAMCVTTPVCGNEPSGAGWAETGAKITATWQLRTLPPTYIVCPLIVTS